MCWQSRVWLGGHPIPKLDPIDLLLSNQPSSRSDHSYACAYISMPMLPFGRGTSIMMKLVDSEAEPTRRQ